MNQRDIDARLPKLKPFIRHHWTFPCPHGSLFLSAMLWNGQTRLWYTVEDFDATIEWMERLGAEKRS